MKEKENISNYFLRMDVIVNAIRGPREDVPDEAIIKKVLTSLTKHYDTKVSTIE